MALISFNDFYRSIKGWVNTGANATYAAFALIDCSTRHDEVVVTRPAQPNPSDHVDFKVVNMLLSLDDLEQLKRIAAIKQYSDKSIKKNDLITLNQLFQDIALRNQVDKSVIETLEKKYNVAASNRKEVNHKYIFAKVIRIRQEAVVEQSVF